MSEPMRDPIAADPGGEYKSSSSMALTLALSSGLSDSFSSMAKVVTDATLLPSRLAGFCELAEEESWVVFSSKLAEARGPFRDEHTALAV